MSSYNNNSNHHNKNQKLPIMEETKHKPWRRLKYYKRSTEISESSPASQENYVYFNIPDMRAALDLRSIYFKLKMKVGNGWQANTLFTNGGIQRFIRKLQITDGRNNIIEDNENYNFTVYALDLIYIEEDDFYKYFQNEGIYEHPYSFMNSGPVRVYPGMTDATSSQNGALPSQGLGIVDDTAESAIANPTFESKLSIHRELQFGDYTWVLNPAQDDVNLTRPYMMITPASFKNSAHYLQPDPFDQLTVEISSKLKGIIDTKSAGKYIFPSGPLNIGHTVYNSVNPAASANTFAFSDSQCILVFPRPTYTPYWKHVMRKFANNEAATFTFQLRGSGFLQMHQHVPLWLMKGLTIRFQIEKDNIAFTNYRQSLSQPVNAMFTQADIHYSLMYLEPDDLAAVDYRAKTAGIRLMYPKYHVVERRVKGAQKRLQEAYPMHYKMLDKTLVYFKSIPNTESNATIFKDSFRWIRTNPKRRYWDYNQVQLPLWGTDKDLEDIDHYMDMKESCKYKSKITYGEFGSLSNEVAGRSLFGPPTSDTGNSELYMKQRVKEVFATSFRCDPSDIFSGIKVATKKPMILHMTLGDDISSEDKILTVIFKYYSILDIRLDHPQPISIYE